TDRSIERDIGVLLGQLHVLLVLPLREDQRPTVQLRELVDAELDRSPWTIRCRAPRMSLRTVTGDVLAFGRIGVHVASSRHGRHYIRLSGIATIDRHETWNDGRGARSGVVSRGMWLVVAGDAGCTRGRRDARCVDRFDGARRAGARRDVDAEGLHERDARRSDR